MMPASGNLIDSGFHQKPNSQSAMRDVSKAPHTFGSISNVLAAFLTRSEELRVGERRRAARQE
jgi:hypothetical protein